MSLPQSAMSRRLALFIFALLGLALGVYFMPRVNPFFASRPELNRNEARTIVDQYAQQRGYDLREFFSDGIYIYDGFGLEYLMEKSGVGPAIALGRADRLPLSYWQFDFYRNVPRDNQQETFQARISPTGKLLGFRHTLPDSARGDTLSAAAALQLAQQTLQNWPGVRFADFKLEQSSSAKKSRRTDHRLIFTRTGDEVGEGAEVLEVSIAGTELNAINLTTRDGNAVGIAQSRFSLAWV